MDKTIKKYKQDPIEFIEKAINDQLSKVGGMAIIMKSQYYIN